MVAVAYSPADCRLLAVHYHADDLAGNHLITGHLPLAGCLWKERNRNEPEKVPIRPG